MLNITKFKKNKRYLLACSGGVDSIALYNLLKENEIDFDVASINYNFREQSKLEINNVKELCKKDDKKLHLYENTKSISTNMEKEARDIRYNYFDKLMLKYNYEALLTGHNLNDKVEWFLMQFTKGAGVKELTGMNLESERNSYKTLKPLIETERTDIEKYIEDNNLISFYDESNSDLTYHPTDNPQGIRRNYFRHNFAAKLTKEFKNGIRKSFDILEKEAEEMNEYQIEKVEDKVIVITLQNKKETNMLRAIDFVLKRDFTHLLNGGQRKEIVKQQEKGIVINDISIGFYDNKILITPYISSGSYSFSKEEKENFRKMKVPAKNRKYLLENKIKLNLKEK